MRSSPTTPSSTPPDVILAVRPVCMIESVDGSYSTFMPNLLKAYSSAPFASKKPMTPDSVTHDSVNLGPETTPTSISSSSGRSRSLSLRLGDVHPAHLEDAHTLTLGDPAVVR